MQMVAQMLSAVTGSNTTSAGVTPTPTAAPVNAGGDRAKGDISACEEWADDVVEHLTEQAKTLEGKIRSFMKARRVVEQKESMLKVLTDDQEHIRYPPGIKACIVGRKEGECETEWSKTVSGDYQVSFVVPKGTSRRRAIEILHHNWQTVRCQVELEIDKDIADRRKEEAKEEHFISACERL